LRVQGNPYDPSNRRVSILVKNGDGPGTKLAAGKGATASPANPEAAEGKVAAPGEAPPAQTQAAPAAPASGSAKPSAAAPAAKPGLMDRLKGMMPGRKK
jgi:uncharacterized membrane protein